MRAGDKTESMDVLLHHVFGFLDPFGNFDFLFAGEQRDLTHLLEIHAHGIIENIELRFALLLLLFFLLLIVLFPVFVTVDLGCFDDVDLHPAQSREDGVEFIGVGDTFRQGVVQVVEGEVTLFFRELDQLTNAALNFSGGTRRHCHFAPRSSRPSADAPPRSDQSADAPGFERNNLPLPFQFSPECRSYRSGMTAKAFWLGSL